MSLQIAIPKVLVSHPEGRATIAALNADLWILNTSGADWTDRLRRLAARAPTRRNLGKLDQQAAYQLSGNRINGQATPLSRCFGGIRRGLGQRHVRA